MVADAVAGRQDGSRSDQGPAAEASPEGDGRRVAWLRRPSDDRLLAPGDGHIDGTGARQDRTSPGGDEAAEDPDPPIASEDAAHSSPFSSGARKPNALILWRSVRS